MRHSLISARGKQSNELTVRLWADDVPSTPGKPESARQAKGQGAEKGDNIPPKSCIRDSLMMLNHTARNTTKRSRCQATLKLKPATGVSLLTLLQVDNYS